MIPRRWTWRGLAALLGAALLNAAPAEAQERWQDLHVGSAVCAACHEGEAEAWRGSHHQLAWTEATAETVVADFDGTEFSHDGMTARFRIGADGGYFVEVTEKDGVTTDHRIHSVAGIAPLQQYLIETEPGRVQSFDVVWDVEGARWFHLYPDQDLPPDDGLHWTGVYKSWNARCAECHATGFEKRYDARTRTYASRQAEMGVGCESCHGPGAAHVGWAQGEAGAPMPANGGFSADFSTTGGVMEQCAACHARREAQLDGNPQPGTPFHDAYALSLLFEGQYHADGQILDEVYVYGSFLQSKMHRQGVGCLDCHDAHSAGLRADGNATCTQCHSPAGNPEFPTLRPADYEDPAHHGHAPDGEGAQCVACHMIERVYMGVDGRRDHGFRIPRPDLAARTGGPDACTDCHEDRSAGWAAERIAEWHPDPRNRRPHFGEVLARGRADALAASGELTALSLDEAQPGIVRATALWLLRREGDAAAADAAAPLLEDPDPMVRAGAVALQVFADPQDRVLRVSAALDDPVRTVRMEAAKAMLGAPVARLPARLQAALSEAMAEWQGAVSTRLDFPETHLAIAGSALTIRNFAVAENAFAEATRLDPQRADAWVMRVRIAAATRGREEAGAVLAEALRWNRADPTLRDFAEQLGVPVPD